MQSTWEPSFGSSLLTCGPGRDLGASRVRQVKRDMVRQLREGGQELLPYQAAAVQDSLVALTREANDLLLLAGAPTTRLLRVHLAHLWICCEQTDSLVRRHDSSFISSWVDQLGSSIDIGVRCGTHLQRPGCAAAGLLKGLPVVSCRMARISIRASERPVGQHICLKPVIPSRDLSPFLCIETPTSPRRRLRLQPQRHFAIAPSMPRCQQAVLFCWSQHASCCDHPRRPQVQGGARGGPEAGARAAQLGAGTADAC